MNSWCLVELGNYTHFFRSMLADSMTGDSDLWVVYLTSEEVAGEHFLGVWVGAEDDEFSRALGFDPGRRHVAWVRGDAFRQIFPISSEEAKEALENGRLRRERLKRLEESYGDMDGPLG